ncbi:MAG: methyltransferase domain-containing protein [Verrucomicrobia bacterium]|nr:methyltransferase domain-containing protein [Verrucomicrobiota bacterium]
MSRLRARCWIALVLSVLSCASLRSAHAAQGSASRSDAIRALCARLRIGPGAVVADVGCGHGPDTMVFAAVVGNRGTVFAQDIDPAGLKRVVATAGQRGFRHVVPVLGQTEDPHLPDGLADLVYMNRVFHHFARPRSMLQRLHADLKPGGWLVIVDQHKGPLKDWAPTDSREQQHHWTSELTVSRLAHEAGFVFDDVLEELWHEKSPFVLAFRKPAGASSPEAKPGAGPPWDERHILASLPLAAAGNGVVLFIGLDDGRALLPVLKGRLPASSRLYDVVLEEWAVSKDELPPGAPASGVEILRTVNGEVALPAGAAPGLVVVADAYHRLWDPAPLLRRLQQHMPPSGRLAVLDRTGPEAESRRLGNHRRRISPERVIGDMRRAGFQLHQKLSDPGGNRFFLVFAAHHEASGQGSI